MQENLNKAGLWLVDSHNAFWRLIHHSDFLPALWFILAILGVLMLIAGGAGLWVFLKPKKLKNKDTNKPKDHLDYNSDQILNIIEKDNHQRYIVVSRSALSKSEFENGDKVKLELILKEVVGEDGKLVRPNVKKKSVSVTIQEKIRRGDQRQDLIELSRLTVNQFAFEVSKDEIDTILIRKLSDIRNIWARTFGHPDTNIKLGWQLFFWSFVAGILGNILVDRLPF